MALAQKFFDIALNFVHLVGVADLHVDTADVRYAGVFFRESSTSSGDLQTGITAQHKYCDWTLTGNNPELVVSQPTASSPNSSNRSFRTFPSPSSSQNQVDPWVSSALIEYDQPYPNSRIGAAPNANRDNVNSTSYVNLYPNHCLALCMNVYCSNKPLGASTYSIAFPLQQIRFDIVKYYNNKNISNPEETPPVRTIDLYPNPEQARCGSYRCPGSPTSGYVCNSAAYYCTELSSSDNTKCAGTSETDTHCHDFATGGNVSPTTCKCDSNKVCNFAVFNLDGTDSVGTRAIPFCAAWDGSREIAGEFGKENGQYGFRATVATNVPGDSQIVDKIEFNSTIAYPGMNQIPIQVDVTNVHTVRSTPTLVGNITAVSAQPYTYSYRLSKDADMRIAVYDGSSQDAALYGNANTGAGVASIGSATYSEEDNKPRKLNVRTLVDWQPRLGEGMRGQERDVQISEFDSWDGRNNDGLLLPAGNYVVSLQAKTADEWPGIDFSRAVTRQLSLDPLKLTDVVSTGLNKRSTAYASISYVPTEASTVYWEIYTPGTVFENAGSPAGILTDSSAATGTSPSVTDNTGSLVARIEETRLGRLNFTSRWDGTCQVDSTIIYRAEPGETYPAGAVNPAGQPVGGQVAPLGCGTFPCLYTLQCVRYYTLGERMSDGVVCSTTSETYANGVCTQTFAYGSPMPDGNYVYALWAEVPYNGKYVNAAGSQGNPNFYAGAVCGTEATGGQTGFDDGAQEINGQCFTGVKTLKYTTGEIAVERGLVDVTIQPVSYSVVGSSPTAYGLDPFIFKYSIARDATVVAKVTNTAGVDVKYLTPREGVSQVASQMNTMSWDGRDDAGRMVTAGTYMFVVETKD